MAIIENMPDFEKFTELVSKMDAPELIAQHLVLRGAEHALHSACHLVSEGAARVVLGEMLDNVRNSKRIVEVAAADRDITLITEEE